MKGHEVVHTGPEPCVWGAGGTGAGAGSGSGSGRALRLVVREVLAREVQCASQLPEREGRVRNSGWNEREEQARERESELDGRCHHAKKAERPRCDLGWEDSLKDAKAHDDAQHLHTQREVRVSSSGDRSSRSVAMGTLWARAVPWAVPAPRSRASRCSRCPRRRAQRWRRG